MKIIFLFFLSIPLFVFSQNDTNISLEGHIISINEIGINKLVKKYKAIQKSKGGVNGWRVQLKFKAKEAEILQIKLDFIKLYPKIPVYLKYDEPYYKIRVGDCRTKLQAIKIQHLINNDFPGSYPVPEIINLSKLKN